MGTLFRPKGVCACGLARLAGRLRICGSGRFLGSLSDSICVDPEDLWLAPLGPPLLLEEVVVHGSAFLHPVQGLYVRGHARPRSIAVRAASRCSAPAHEVRSRVEPSFDGPRRADEGSTCSRDGQAASRVRGLGSRCCDLFGGHRFGRLWFVFGTGRPASSLGCCWLRFGGWGLCGLRCGHGFRSRLHSIWRRLWRSVVRHIFSHLIGIKILLFIVEKDGE